MCMGGFRVPRYQPFHTEATMINTDYDPDQAAKAIARAHGVPAWVASAPSVEYEYILDYEHDVNFPVASSYEPVSYHHDHAGCCAECADNDERELDRIFANHPKPDVYCDAC